jgi:parvulin-like peptidyl-prolyl isomerase
MPATSETGNESEVIAMVNHVEIKKNDLNRLISQFKQKAGKEHVTLDEKKQLLKNLTIRQLILQSLEAQALRKEEPVVKKVAEFENSLIITQFIKNNVGNGITLKKGELAEYYKDHKTRFRSDEKIEANVILLRTETDAAMVLGRLKKGEVFKDMAREFSIDLPSAKKGGNLGIIKIGTVYPQVWKELKRLNPGEISNIIETKYGYNILMTNKILAPEIKPFEEVKTEISNALLREKREKAYDEMVKKLEKNANLKIFENRLAETGGKE